MVMVMNLKHFDGRFGLRVLRDGEFLGTGKLSTPLPGRLVPLRSERFLKDTNSSKNVSAVITVPSLADMLDERLAVAVCENPDAAHSEIHVVCAEKHDVEQRQKITSVHSTARIHERAWIAPYGVTIGAGATVGPNCVLYPGVVLDEECHIHANCVIGDAAFNLGLTGGKRRFLPSLGGVRIGRGAELAAGVNVDAAMFGGHTTIGTEAAIDHQAYIAHDVQIGALVTICGHAAIMGRVEIGDHAYIGPGAVIVNGASIGRGAKVSMGAVVTRDVDDGQVVTGNFALPHARFLDNLRRDRITNT